MYEIKWSLAFFLVLLWPICDWLLVFIFFETFFSSSSVDTPHRQACSANTFFCNRQRKNLWITLMPNLCISLRTHYDVEIKLFTVHTNKPIVDGYPFLKKTFYTHKKDISLCFPQAYLLQIVFEHDLQSHVLHNVHPQPIIVFPQLFTHAIGHFGTGFRMIFCLKN